MISIPIPLYCVDAPVGPDGIIRGFVLARAKDGSSTPGQHSLSRSIECWARGLCQLCGYGIERAEGTTLLGGPEEIRDLLFEEPPLHKTCADYHVQVDPRFRTGTWYAIHTPAYAPAVSSQGELYGGRVDQSVIRTVRLLRPDGKTADRYRDITALRQQLLAEHPREEPA